LGKSVREVEGFGAGELAEWEAYWRHEPWGAYRDNIHSALICSILANVHRKKGAPAIEYEQFMLKDRQEHLTTETTKTLAWFRAVGKRK
jgi:hypothetical protein